MCRLRSVCVALRMKPVIVVICSSSAKGSFARFFLEDRGFLLYRQVWELGRNTAVVFTLTVLTLPLEIQWSAQDSFIWSEAFFWRSPMNQLSHKIGLRSSRVTLAPYGSIDLCMRPLYEQWTGKRNSTAIRMLVARGIRLRLIALVSSFREWGEW